MFELDRSHDYSDEDIYGSSGKSFYESRDKGGKSKIHRHHPYDGRLVLRSGEREPYDGRLGLRSGEGEPFYGCLGLFSGEGEPYDGHLGLRSGEGETYDGRLGLRSGEGETYDGRLGLLSGEGETSLFFSQSATASDVNFHVPKNEDPENSEIELVIVAVTKMPGGKCLMGFDQRDRFWRSIYKTEVGDYSWDKKKWFTLGNKYKFTRRPIAARGDFPHRTEDIMVLEDVEDLKRRSYGLFNRMLRIAKEKPEDIFPQLEYENGKIFVDTKTRCPSVGVLKCKEATLRLQPNMTKKEKEKSRG